MFPTSNPLLSAVGYCIYHTLLSVIVLLLPLGLLFPPSIEGFVTVVAAGGPPLLLLCGVVLCVVRWRRASSLPQISILSYLYTVLNILTKANSLVRPFYLSFRDFLVNTAMLRPDKRPGSQPTGTTKECHPKINRRRN